MEKLKNITTLNINSSCRTCLENVNNSETYHNVFAIPDLGKKLTVCTSLPVEPDDGFPSCLCESCLKKINDFYNFQQMCISARKQFQDYINSENKLKSFELGQVHSIDLSSVLEIPFEAKKEDNDDTDFVDANVISQGESSSTEVEDSDDDEPIVKYLAAKKDSSTNSKLIENKDSFNDTKDANSKKSNSSSTKPNLHCEICNKGFTKTETFDIHMRMHQGLKPFPCQQCDKSYARPGRLKVHMRVVHEGKPFPCTEMGCNKTLSSKQTLRQHIAEMHSPKDENIGIKEKPRFVCEECGKVLKGLSTLKNHRFLHSGQPRPHACPQCHKRYMTRCKLKEHMNRHAGIKNFVCPHCGAKKSSRSELKNHVNYHTKEKTYPCHICNMVFNNIVNYSRHRRVVHEGIKNFACSYCDKSFGKAETRKHHEMTHTGEKPHECNICHKKFIQIVSLKKHQKVHLKAMGNG